MRPLTGSIFVVIAAMGFGFMGLLGSWALRDGVSIQMMLFLRFAIAGVIMLIIMVSMRLPVPRGSNLLGLIGMGAALYVGEAMFFFHSGQYIPYGLTSLLLYIYPVIVTLFARLVWRQRLSAGKLTALGLAVWGLAMTIGPMLGQPLVSKASGGDALIGIGLGLACCLSYSVYILVGGAMARRSGAIQAATVVILSAAAALGALALLRHDSFPTTAAAWSGIVLLALVSTVVPITAVLVGLERIGPVQTSTLSTLEPVVTVIVGSAWMGQHLNWIQIGGGALIVAAAVIVARSGAGDTEASRAKYQIVEIH